MGLINWDWFGFNSSKRFYEDKINFVNEQIGITTPIYIDLNNLAKVYKEIPQLKMVIDKNAELLSKLEWELYNGEKQIESHPVLELLYNPNPLQSGKDFIFQLSLMEDIFGNAFIYKNKGTFDVKQLSILPSDKIEVELSGMTYKQTSIEEIVKFYKLVYNGVVNDKFEPNEIIHLRNNDNNQVISDSKILTLQKPISNIKGAYDSRNVLINERGAIGILSYEGGDALIGLSAQDKIDAEKKLTEQYGTKKGQRRINISTIPVKYQNTAIPTKDLMLFEEIDDDFNVIIDQYGLNRDIFSGKNSTFENQNQALKGVFMNNIIPRANRLANTLTNQLLADTPYTLKAKFNVEVLKENEKEEAEKFKIKVEALNSMIDRGLITEVEYKEMLENE